VTPLSKLQIEQLRVFHNVKLPDINIAKIFPFIGNFAQNLPLVDI
jgi:hypothetical protein